MNYLSYLLLALHLTSSVQAQVPKTTCQISNLNGIVTHRFTYAEPSPAGDLSATVEQSVNTLEKLANGAASFKIFLQGEEYLTQNIELLNGTASKKLTWGKKIQGLNKADFKVENGIVIGSLDQRALKADLRGLDLDLIKLPADLGKRQIQSLKPINLNPIHLNPIKIEPTPPPRPLNTNLNLDKISRLANLKNILKFADSSPAPVVTTDPTLNSTTAEFTNRLLESFKSCTQTFSPPTDSTNNILPAPVSLDRRQDPGHPSNPYSTGSCNRCKVLSVGAIVLAEIGCVTATCWWSFGLGCVACTATAATASVAAIQGCEWSGACCPVTCGSGSFPLKPPTCCFGNESCLDGNGKCCSQGQVACAGKACCNSGQSCMSSGVNKGTCCPDKAVCGAQCCRGDDQECVGGKYCCARGDTCGERCCNPLSTEPNVPNFNPSYCANRGKSLCCPVGTVEIGQSGVCCKEGSRLVDGRCSVPGAVQCGGMDCLGVCVGGSCRWDPSDQDCLFMGFKVGSCKRHLNTVYECGRCSENGCCMQPGPK